jgi:hypothetical protein
MAKQLDLVVKRGTTLQSPKIFSVNEPVPANISYAELMAGIEAETYTLKSLDGYTHVGHVRERPNTAIKAELVFDTTDDKLSWSIPASVTATWDNELTVLFYDVFRTHVSTGVVTTVAEGKITVNSSITAEEV